MKYVVVLSLVLSAGCSENRLSFVNEDADESNADRSVECDASIQGISPSLDQGSILPEAEIRVDLSEAVTLDSVDILVSTSGQSSDVIEGTVSLSDDGLVATFTPQNDLSRSTDYYVTASACGNDASSAFYTVGEPLTELSTVFGKTFALDLNDMNITSPPAIGPLIQGYLVDYILVEITGGNDALTLLDAKGAAAWDYDEFMMQACEDTVTLNGADFSNNPIVVVDFEEYAADVEGAEIIVEQLQFEGEFAQDGSSLDYLNLSAYVKASPLTPILEEHLNLSGDACFVLETITAGAAVCEACPVSGDIDCIHVQGNALSAAHLEGHDGVQSKYDVCQGEPYAYYY